MFKSFGSSRFLALSLAFVVSGCGVRDAALSAGADYTGNTRADEKINHARQAKPIVEQTRMIGQALLNLALDSDGKLPPEDTDLKASLKPYLYGTDGQPRGGKSFDESLFDRLTYIAPGQNLLKLPKPDGEYALAYIEDETGIYVLYADGQVREWTGSDKPSNS